MRPRAQEPILLGVRHHGPGSARAVAAALERTAPDVVLIEGPPEGDALLRFAADPALCPPVALLAHAVDDPGQAAFWPYAAFSPEWAAIRYAVARGLPARFIDLPVGVMFALARRPCAAPGPDTAGGPDRGGPEDGEPGEPGDGPDPWENDAGRDDPIAVLARLAGHDDPERWWDDVIEHRLVEDDDVLAAFAVLGEAMAMLRDARRTNASPGAPDPDSDPDQAPGTAAGEPAGETPAVVERLREASMRQAIRAARRAGHRRIAVVCGAWHVPALAHMPPAAADRALLAPYTRGRVRVETTWVPWTHRRLGQASGYGAGVASPGWYEHLHRTVDRAGVLPRWFVHVAALLRDAGHPVSSAHVIEAVRHAGALAALRGRPQAGLDETLEAVRAVMCDGGDGPLALIRDALLVGDRIGKVPDTVPAVPLQRDLAREQRRLRLKAAAEPRDLELDLRDPTHLERSRLLYRLDLLDIAWGVPATARGGKGGFREAWRLVWQPELAIRVAEAGVWGTTVAAAAGARAADLARHAESLAEVTAVAERCLRAGLADALPVVMRVLDERAALDTDVTRLAEALPALVRTLRYGDARGTDTSALDSVVSGLLVRVNVGLVPACAALDAAGARRMCRHIEEVHTAVRLLGDGRRDDWYATLGRLAEDGGLPGLLPGRATRMLVDDGRLAPGEAAPRLARALTRGVPHRVSAAWIEGFLAGGGMLVVHDERLTRLLDEWIAAIPEDLFSEVLPLLRRTFATFTAPERRMLGERLRAGPAAGPAAEPGGRDGRPPTGTGAAFDPDRADAVLPLVAALLGVRKPAPIRRTGGAGGVPRTPHATPGKPSGSVSGPADSVHT